MNNQKLSIGDYDFIGDYDLTIPHIIIYEPFWYLRRSCDCEFQDILNSPHWHPNDDIVFKYGRFCRIHAKMPN